MHWLNKIDKALTIYNKANKIASGLSIIISEKDKEPKAVVKDYIVLINKRGKREILKKGFNWNMFFLSFIMIGWIIPLLDRRWGYALIDLFLSFFVLPTMIWAFSYNKSLIIDRLNSGWMVWEGEI